MAESVGEILSLVQTCGFHHFLTAYKLRKKINFAFLDHV